MTLSTHFPDPVSLSSSHTKGILVFNCYNEKELLYALIICLLYSISDEIHQIFIVGRSCELFDIFIDTIGSFFEINILNIIRKNKF